MGLSIGTPLFVICMVRSGTTLLGHVLNTNSDISLVQVPYLPVYKSLRNAIAWESGDDELKAVFGPDQPL